MFHNAITACAWGDVVLDVSHAVVAAGVAALFAVAIRVHRLNGS